MPANPEPAPAQPRTVPAGDPSRFLVGLRLLGTRVLPLGLGIGVLVVVIAWMSGCSP